MKNELVKSTLDSANVHLCIANFATGNHLISAPHYHDELEILNVISGAIYVSVNGTEHKIPAGSGILISPRIPHSTYLKGESCKHHLIQFKLENFLGDSINAGKYFNRFIQSASTPFTLYKSSELSRVIEELFSEYEKKQSEYEIIIKGKLFHIIGLLMRERILPDGSAEYPEQIIKLLPSIAYIEEHFSEKITLEEISAVQRLAPSYFCRLFKRASGTGFVEYLNFVRICKSERLLSDTQKSVLEISYELGFSSVSYFNRLFRRYKNCTPSEYRTAQHTSG